MVVVSHLFLFYGKISGADVTWYESHLPLFGTIYFPIAPYSDAYVGDSGRLQVTFQAPVLSDGRQVGALYADKTLSRYNDPALFTFSGGSGNAYVVDGCMGSWIIESTGSNTEDIYEFLDR